MRPRAVSELYAALILLTLSIIVASILAKWVATHIPQEEPTRPILVLKINETHAICYTSDTVNLSYWRDVGEFKCWILPDIDGNTLSICPQIVSEDTYILITPPWLCR